MTSLALACRLGAVTAPRSIPRRVRSILSKYGATMLLPGVSGAMRFGYQPGNYRESTGQTLAGADQQVGLVVDAARSPGPELLPTLNFSSWVPINGATVVSPTSFSTTVGGGMRLNGLLTPGKMYAVTVTFTISAGTLSLFADSVKSELVSGAAVRIVADGTGFLYLRNSGAANTVVSGISVRELPGIHASQSTSGFQPVLRNTAGIQSWQFDGADDRLALSAVPFQMADDHFVVVGFNPQPSVYTATFFYVGGANSTPMCPRLSVAPSGGVTVTWRDDSNTACHLVSPAIVYGDAVIVSARRASGTGVLRVNGNIAGASSTNPGPTTLTQAFIGCGSGGASVYDFNKGHIHGVIFGKGAITDSELLTLERFMANLQGRQL